MNLDHLTIEIRPRRPWEAVDLGLLMARRWWWPMMKAWLLITLPVFLLLSLLPSGWLWLSSTLIWWLKPIFERPLLHILSQAVFNQVPDTRRTLRAFPSLARRQLFLSLTWRRFSPSRSMDFPVVQLEELHGKHRHQRLAILHREDSSPAAWLTIIGAHIEAFLGIGAAMLLYALIPSEIEIDWWGLVTTQDKAWFLFLMEACAYVAITLVVPFYVACGFSLYLNRRIKLEAWDIDLAFRQMVKKRRPPMANLTLAALLIITLGAGITYDAAAATVDEAVITPSLAEDFSAPYSRDSAKASIENVLAGDDFHQKRVLHYPSFNDPEDDENGFWDWLFALLPAWEWGEFNGLPGIADVLEVILWGAVLSLMAIVVFRYRRWLLAFLPQHIDRPKQRTLPLRLFGLDLTRESLPADVSSAALALWQKDEQRHALALLYRASLSRLLEAGMAIEDGYTEEECLQVARAYGELYPQTRAAINYFADLTRAWQRLAYGHLAPNEQQAETLCRAWNDAWRLTAAAPAREAAHD